MRAVVVPLFLVVAGTAASAPASKGSYGTREVCQRFAQLAAMDEAPSAEEAHEGVLECERLLQAQAPACIDAMAELAGCLLEAAQKESPPPDVCEGQAVAAIERCPDLLAAALGD